MILPVQAVGSHVIECGEGSNVVVDGEAEARGELQHRDVTTELGPARHFAELIAEERQVAAGRDARVLLTKAACRRVARVDERPLPRFHGALVELLEARPCHVHLATHLDHGRRPFGEFVGNVTDRRHVGGHVLSHPTVAAGRGLHEATALVAQTDGQTVELQLAHERRDITIEAPDHPIGPGTEFVRVHGVVQAHHRYPVGDRSERGADRPADQPGRRIVGNQIGVIRFDLVQLTDESVVVGVTDLGVVERVIPLVVVGDLRPEFIDPERRGRSVIAVRGHRRPRLRREPGTGIEIRDEALAHHAPRARRVADD